ncbi:MAG: glutathione S-transferase [Myxococcaceae bacterium]|nr:glutathione S-transferase [Myxococcaceae bacterium]
MDLYFSPLACSMATRVALYEAGAPARYIEVDSKSKRTLDGDDFLALNPLGLVPVLRTDNLELLTESSAILQHVARLFPDAQLAPTDELGLARLQQWLCFIAAELHKGLFAPLLDSKAPEVVKSYTRDKYLSRTFGLLDDYLEDREFLLDSFSVADAYLVAVLGWAAATAIDLATWPALAAYVKRLHARPSIARALSEERALYVREKARSQQASSR